MLVKARRVGTSHLGSFHLNFLNDAGIDTHPVSIHALEPVQLNVELDFATKEMQNIQMAPYSFEMQLPHHPHTRRCLYCRGTWTRIRWQRHAGAIRTDPTNIPAGFEPRQSCRLET